MNRAIGICGLVAALTVGAACSSTKPKQQTPPATAVPTNTAAPTYTPTPADIITDDVTATNSLYQLMGTKGVTFNPTPSATPLDVMICMPNGTCVVVDKLRKVATNDVGTSYSSDEVYFREVGNLPSSQATAVSWANSTTVPGAPKIFAPDSGSYSGIQATNADYWVVLNGLHGSWETLTGRRIFHWP